MMVSGAGVTGAAGWTAMVIPVPPVTNAACVNTPGFSDDAVSCLEPAPIMTFVAAVPPVPLVAGGDR